MASRATRITYGTSWDQLYKRITFLRTIPLFHALDQKEVEAIVSKFEVVRFERGETILREGDVPLPPKKRATSPRSSASSAGPSTGNSPFVVGAASGGKRLRQRQGGNSSRAGSSDSLDSGVGAWRTDPGNLGPHSRTDEGRFYIIIKGEVSVYKRKNAKELTETQKGGGSGGGVGERKVGRGSTLSPAT